MGRQALPVTAQLRKPPSLEFPKVTLKGWEAGKRLSLSLGPSAEARPSREQDLCPGEPCTPGAALLGALCGGFLPWSVRGGGTGPSRGLTAVGGQEQHWGGCWAWSAPVLVALGMRVLRGCLHS